jgi:hypothetical protein
MKKSLLFQITTTIVMMTMMMIINKTIGSQEIQIGVDGFQTDDTLMISTGQVQI